MTRAKSQALLAARERRFASPAVALLSQNARCFSLAHPAGRIPTGRTGPRRPRRRRHLVHGLLVLLAAGFAGRGEADAAGGGSLVPVQRGERQPVHDPFRARGSSSAPRPPGLAGVGVTEAVVRGIVRYRVAPGAATRPDPPGWAILESPGGEGFVAAPGDRLLDGVLGRIEAGGVVFWLEGDPDRPVYRPLAPPADPEEEP